MSQVTVRIDSKVHAKVKARARKAGLKIGRLTEILLEQWLSGQVFFAPDSTVKPSSETAQ